MEVVQRTLQGLILQEFAALQIGKKAEKAPKRVTYKKFVTCRPSEFNGEMDPLIAIRWILDMEGTFETSRCDPADRVIFAGSQLKQRGKDWWDLLREELGLEGLRALSWEEFKEQFSKWFSSQAAISRIYEKFFHLRQKDENIDTITAIFYEKAKFCGDFLRTEKMWINQYYGMLNAKYREFLTPSKCETLAKLIDCACEREAELKR